MLILEEHGLNFTHDQMRRLWLTHIPPYQAYGPERWFVVQAGMGVCDLENQDEAFYRDFVTVGNPEDEHCGAMIRADAYGYASAGNPQQAARLAWRDASLTHRRTGIYGTMFAAAAIAAAPVVRDPLDVFETALKFVPQRSRYYRIVCDALNEIGQADDWIDGYNRIHDKYGEYGHCRVYQESGTLINTLRFAESIGDGFCKQVSQGNDTDSYGATSGSILGMFFGPGHLEERWLAPLNDTIYTTLAALHEQSLSRLARRMSDLPVRFAGLVGISAPDP
jgi:ADP-ribosylglycohydrolase